MDNPVTISLAVSGIGMLLLFLALAFLYGLMYLMTALIKDRPEAEAEEQGSEGAEEKRRAAVVAVAVARAEQDRVPPPSIPSIGGEERRGETVSAWWALHHQRQLTLNLPTRRAR